MFPEGQKILKPSLFVDIMNFLFSKNEDEPIPQLRGKKQKKAAYDVFQFLWAQKALPPPHGYKRYPHLRNMLNKHRSSLKFLSENVYLQPLNHPADQAGAGFFVNFDKWNHNLDY